MKTKNIIFLCLIVIAAIAVTILSETKDAGAVITASFALAGITPQNKIRQVVDKGFGMPSIMKQQGTTRVVYDTLELTPTTNYLYFFKDCNTRKFPFTNLGSFGNKLEAGETLSVLYASINILRVPQETPRSVMEIVPATFPDIIIGELSLNIANTTVLKPIRLQSFVSAWNKTIKSTTVNVFTFDTILVIPPMLEFTAIVQLDGYSHTPVDTVDYLQLTIEGVGSIIAPKQTM